MSFVETNKRVIVPVVAGALMGLVLGWLDLPEWLIGALVAGAVVLWNAKMIEAYDRHVAPKLNGKD